MVGYNQCWFSKKQNQAGHQAGFCQVGTDIG